MVSIAIVGESGIGETGIGEIGVGEIGIGETGIGEIVPPLANSGMCLREITAHP